MGKRREFAQYAIDVGFKQVYISTRIYQSGTIVIRAWIREPFCWSRGRAEELPIKTKVRA